MEVEGGDEAACVGLGPSCPSADAGRHKPPYGSAIRRPPNSYTNPLLACNGCPRSPGI